MVASRTRLVVFSILLLLALVGCREAQVPLDNPDIQISISILPDPPVTGESLMQITVQDAVDRPINNAQVEIRGDMTHAGMEPVLRTATQGEHGVYEVPFEWTMGGDWFVEVIATRPDGTAGRAIFNYTLAGDTMP